MSTFDAPAWLLPAQLEFGAQKSGVQFSGPFNGTRQAAEFVADRWVASVSLPGRKRVNAGAVEAFFNLMAGGVHRVRLPHLGSGTVREPYAPRGTLRGAPTLRVATARGNTTLELTNCAVGATVLAGDMLGCNQLFMAAADAVANGVGQMSVPLVLRVRAATAIGTAVVWQRPTADFIIPSLSARHVYVPAFLASGQFDLEEVW